MFPLWHRSLLPPPISSSAPPSLPGTAPPSPVSSLFPNIPPTPWHWPSSSTLLAPISSPLLSTGLLQPSAPSGTVWLNRAKQKLFGRTEGCLAERRPSVRSYLVHSALFGQTEALRLSSVWSCLIERRASVRSGLSSQTKWLLFGQTGPNRDLLLALFDQTVLKGKPIPGEEVLGRCRRVERRWSRGRVLGRRGDVGSVRERERERGGGGEETGTGCEKKRRKDSLRIFL